MPRTARIKHSIGVYHVIVRSVGDIDLFRDHFDKEKYIKLTKKYQDIFLFKVYAYCIMDNHAHFIIDCCGADISKFMKSINQCYAAYFNKRYNRHGHVFQDRFKSILVNNDDQLRRLTAYVHNNAKDIRECRNCIERYRYSSLGVYLGLFDDNYKILDCDFIQSIIGYYGWDKLRARQAYRIDHDNIENEKIEVEKQINAKGEYRSYRKILVRNFSPEEIIDFVSKHSIHKFNVHVKYNHKNIEMKSICILLMRSLCNFTYKQICDVVGNTTLSNVSRLCEKGLKLITEDEKYKQLIPELIKYHKEA